jgi:hypothetical protein
MVVRDERNSSRASSVNLARHDTSEQSLGTDGIVVIESKNFKPPSNYTVSSPYYVV